MKPRCGRFSFYGKKLGIFYWSLWQSHAIEALGRSFRNTHRMNMRLFSMREYYRDILEKALKNFLWSLHLQANRLYCGIRCWFLSRLEGLYPEIALKNPQKSGCWLLRRNHRSLFFFTLDILYLDLNASGWDRVFGQCPAV